jgi:hypothetical protein
MSKTYADKVYYINKIMAAINYCYQPNSETYKTVEEGLHKLSKSTLSALWVMITTSVHK